MFRAPCVRSSCVQKVDVAVASTTVWSLAFRGPHNHTAFSPFFRSGAGENCVVFLVCEREESYFFLDREKHPRYSTQFWAEEKERERDPTSAKVRSVLPTQNSNKVKVLQKVKLDGRFLGIRFAIFNSRHIEMIFRSFPASAPRKYAIVRTSPKLRRKVVE